MASKIFNATILGAPASGKGTISSRIIKRFEIKHLASGDILRNHIKNKTEIGNEVNKYISEGLLVPDQMITRVITMELSKLSGTNWLLDGFPRTRLQAEELFERYPIKMALNLVVPFSVIIDRVKGRWVHIPSGRVYNVDFNAPKVQGKDDVTGEPLEQRPDDKPEAVQKRLEIYSETVEPVLSFYREKNVLKEFHGKTSDEIWPQVEKILLPFLQLKQ